jgi:AAA+ superfamily predicted ATPase
MPEPPLHEIVPQFRQILVQCRDLYVSSGELVAREHAQLLPGSAAQFVALMDDLHRALLVKVFITVCESDRQWSPNEKILAETLVLHLWNQLLGAEQLREALGAMSAKATALKWYAVVRPFDQIAPLRNRVSELETIVVRLANLIARADGLAKPVEVAQIKSIQEELSVHLRPIPIDEPTEHAAADRAGAQAIERIYTTANELPAHTPSPTGRGQGEGTPQLGAPSAPTPAQQLAEAMAELDRLIGIDNIKQEVRTLANFLKVTAKRKAAGLPTAELSLHMIFGGNPGTGKTTVARIVGKIFSAMGVLAKGHLVETDRSGLVAEYAGQTGPKTHKKIDEALDGVLFIDEAYTLIAAEGDDPYGHEAVQTLLKRMEDNRERLVVILAGYPAEMETLLESNPGLSSRFSRRLDFPDYSPLELARIFGQMCAKNQYRVCSAVRAMAVVGLTWLHSQRDRHFGNGRTVRNVFEDAIRRQANRIAEVSELSVEQLATLDPSDLAFRECPPTTLAPLTTGKLRFHIECPHCRHGKDVPQKFLGQAVKCPKCKQDFAAEWGSVVSSSVPR